LEKRVKSKKRVIRLLSKEDEFFRLCEKDLWEEPKSYKFISFDELKNAVEIYYKKKILITEYKVLENQIFGERRKV